MRRMCAGAGLFAASLFTCSDSRAADKATLVCIQVSDEGQTARDGGNLLRARELFAQCTAPKCPPLIRRDCTSWLEKLEVQIPSIVVGARDAEGQDVADAKVTIDGQPREGVPGAPIELNPGPHLIRWQVESEPSVEMRIALRPQEKNRPVIAMVPRSTSQSALREDPMVLPTPNLSAPSDPHQTPVGAPPKAGLPVATYVLGSVGVAALGTFTYLGLRARRDSNSMHDECAPACAHDDVSALETKLVVADVALGVGAVALGAAACFALFASSSPRASWDLRLAPVVGGARARLDVRF